MITLYDILKLLQPHIFLEILDSDGYLLQEGERGTTVWEDKFLERQIYMIIPGITTKIILERY